MSGVSHTPSTLAATVMTYYCGNAAMVCQIYASGSAFYGRTKFDTTWSEWKLLSFKAEDMPIGKNEYCSVSLFQTIGAIGDSFTSGGVLNDDGTGIVNNYPISWPQIMARHEGITAINYSATGADISRFLTETTPMSSWRIDKLEDDQARDLYIIVMGINGEKSLSDSSTSVDVGTTADIDKSDYTQNADTFCGHYGQMLSRIIDHAPNSKIICVVPVGMKNTEKGNAIEDIAELFELPCFAMSDDSFYLTTFYTSNLQMGHPTAPVYSGMAKAFARQICECVADNASYFNNFRPQE